MVRTLFEKTKINQIELMNRFVRSATWENMADRKGHLTAKLLRVYEELAQTRIGLIITGCAFILEEHQPNPGMIGIYGDSFIDEFKELTDMVHAYGGKIVIQVDNGSTQARYNVAGRKIWGPSAVADLETGIVATEMTKDDIRNLVRAFGAAAARAKRAGFDGIQIHCAHGYCLSQFLTPHYNRRTDEYGGNIQNRARIVLEVFAEMRKRVGADYAILIKINCEDFVANGLCAADSRYVCGELDKLGIDAIEISGGVWAAKELYTRRPNINSEDKEAYFASYSRMLAKEIKAPVILVGGLRSLPVIEKLLQETSIQYYSLCRPIMREPGLIERWSAGDARKSKCISCNQCFAADGNVCVFHRKKSS